MENKIKAIQLEGPKAGLVKTKLLRSTGVLFKYLLENRKIKVRK